MNRRDYWQNLPPIARVAFRAARTVAADSLKRDVLVDLAVAAVEEPDNAGSSSPPAFDEQLESKMIALAEKVVARHRERR
jgi:hypothetical protein